MQKNCTIAIFQDTALSIRLLSKRSLNGEHGVAVVGCFSSVSLPGLNWTHKAFKKLMQIYCLFLKKNKASPFFFFFHFTIFLDVRANTVHDAM